VSTFGTLYRQAKALLDQRSAESIQNKRVDPRLSREIDELKNIMSGLKQAFLDAGGSKADERSTRSPE
jgi:hypothetical protein